ncbi:MAG: MFS transporter [Bacteroidales bacterium]|nr:MFS transporter [Bacteroidales bacterium]
MAGSINKPLYLETNLKVIFSITLVAVMGVASITPAFPSIIEHFEIEKEHIAWLITAFTLPGIFLTPVMGVLADRFGRKQVLVPSLFLFGIAGVACGFTHNYHALVVLRFFQGMGSAALGSINVTLIGDIYEGKKRAAAMGYNGSVLSIGTALYPALGGALASFGWNYPFFFPILAIPVGLWVIKSLDNPEPEKHEKFFSYLKNALKSMLNRKVVGLFVVSISTFIILYGAYLTVFPLYLKESFNAKPWQIGVIMSAMSVATALTSSFSGKISAKFSKAVIIMAAFTLYIISLVLIPQMPSMIFITIPAFIFGIAQGLNLPASMTFLADLSTIKYRAAFMSVNGMVLRIGQTIGPVLVGLVMASWTLSLVFYLAAALAIVMIVVIWLLLK